MNVFLRASGLFGIVTFCVAYIYILYRQEIAVLAAATLVRVTFCGTSRPVGIIILGVLATFGPFVIVRVR